MIYTHAGATVYILSVYLTPTSSLSVAGERDIWEELTLVFANLPVTEPMVVFGDFNAHLGDVLSSLCPCLGLPRIPLPD